MIETEKKRFWILNVITESSGIKDGDKLLSFDEVVDLLNAFHEEKQKMKEIIENLVNRDAVWEKKARQQVHELKEENKELKNELDKSIEMLNKEINSSEKVFNGLMEENQELKQRLSHLEYRFTEYRNKVNK